MIVATEPLGHPMDECAGLVNLPVKIDVAIRANYNEFQLPCKLPRPYLLPSEHKVLEDPQKNTYPLN